MSKTDRIKAEISFHEKMFFVAIAIVLALTSWGFNNYRTVGGWVLSSAVVALFFSIGFGVWNYRQIKKLLEDLEHAE